jgi:hypothetical protein
LSIAGFENGEYRPAVFSFTMKCSLKTSVHYRQKLNFRFPQPAKKESLLDWRRYRTSNEFSHFVRFEVKNFSSYNLKREIARSKPPGGDLSQTQRALIENSLTLK